MIRHALGNWLKDQFAMPLNDSEIKGKFNSYIFKSDNINSGASQQQGSTSTISSTVPSNQQGSSSAINNTRPSNDFRQTLVEPRANDDVAINRGGFRITYVFIGNLQNKLLRGVSINIDNMVRDNIIGGSVTFSDAIRVFNENYPDIKITQDDRDKLKFILKEKQIYQGIHPWNKIRLDHLVASVPSKQIDHNIRALIS